MESWPQVQEAVEQHWAYSGVKRCAVWHWYMAVIKMIIDWRKPLTAQELTEMTRALAVSCIEGVIVFLMHRLVKMY